MGFNREILLAAVIVSVTGVFITSVSGLIDAEAHKPENAAENADIVAHGTVSEIKDSGEVENHSPVNIDVEEAFRGNISGNLTVQIQGDEDYHVSTAADFEEREEVVVMLQKKEENYFMVNGYASKYRVQNGSVQLTEPDRRNMTLEEMKAIVENTKQEQNASYPDETSERNLLTRLIDFFQGLF